MGNKIYNSKANEDVNLLRSVCGTGWGSDPSTLLLLYKAIIRSHLDYGWNTNTLIG